MKKNSPKNFCSIISHSCSWVSRGTDSIAGGSLGYTLIGHCLYVSWSEPWRPIAKTNTIARQTISSILSHCIRFNLLTSSWSLDWHSTSFVMLEVSKVSWFCSLSAVTDRIALPFLVISVPVCVQRSLCCVMFLPAVFWKKITFWTN